jgi:hypothetical protein
VGAGGRALIPKTPGAPVDDFSPGAFDFYLHTLAPCLPQLLTIARMHSELYPFVFFSLQNLSNKLWEFTKY